MKHLMFKRLAETRLPATLLALAFTLGTGATTLAKSTLVSVSITPQWPTNSQPGEVVLYTLTVTRAGEGNLKVELSAANLPVGATASFSLNPVRFTGRTPKTLTSTLAISCTNLTAADSYPFTITATDKRDPMTITNSATQLGPITAGAAPIAPTLTLDRLDVSTMRLRGQGDSGQTYQIQCTRSMSNPVWAPLGSSTADGNGRFIFLDANPNPPPMLFYRAVLPAP